MALLVLGPMLRHVTETTATIWVETDAPCDVEVLGSSASTFSVHGHHYALVVVRGLPPAANVPYEVALDGERVWPDDPDLPPSVIRTSGRTGDVRVVAGSCRAAAPHHPPYSLERDRDPDARGVDALWATAVAMTHQAPDDWPHLALLLGDQVYADDTSPGAAERIERRRAGDAGRAWPPDDVVADFEEYTWLYREGWSGSLERWFFSVVPTAMIFDDHDMVDDWNISESWVREIRREPWWPRHVVGCLVSYWIYQHLGNQSPDEIEAEGMLAALVAVDDGTDLMEQWALESERFTPLPGGYRFSHARSVDGVRVVVIDSRNGRVLEPGHRRMVDDDEWSWVVQQCDVPCRHLVVASSLPVFVPDGVHGLQEWNEVACDGRWGRRVAERAERLRRRLDLEDWAAFQASFAAMCELLRRLASGATAPTVTVVGGDIHFGYLAEVSLGGPTPVVVHQLVSSPMRNALVTTERGAIRFAAGGAAGVMGRALGRIARRGRRRHHHVEVVEGPVFNNNIAMLGFEPAGTRRVVLVRAVDADGEPTLETAFDRQLL